MQKILYISSFILLLLAGDKNLLAKGEINLVISQERYESNGLLISRPSPLDEKIKDIIIFNRISSLEEYLLWLRENIKYKKDIGRDYWAESLERLNKKSGDGEDFAFLNQAVLRVLGYKPQVLSVLGQRGGHAIYIFKECRYYSLVDNNKLIKTQTESIPELSQYLFRRYFCSSIGVLRLEDKSLKILFK